MPHYEEKIVNLIFFKKLKKKKQQRNAALYQMLSNCLDYKKAGLSVYYFVDTLYITDI